MSLYFLVTRLSQGKPVGKGESAISFQHSDVPNLPAPAAWTFAELLSLAAEISGLVGSNCSLSCSMKET